MPKHIIWSPLSESDFENILEYIKSSWNDQVALSFLDEIENLLKQISTNPKQFPLINKKMKIRKCVVTKHNTIFYREKKGCVEILRIFDTRQNPKKLIHDK